MKAKKNKRQRSEQIQQVSAGLRDLLGMSEWRKEHPKATWAEIEAAVDEQMHQVRAQLLEDLVQMGESEDWSKIPAEERPRCATCGEPRYTPGRLSFRSMRLRWSASNRRCLKHLKEPTSKCGAADGAMVHLIEGEWVEVKTLVLGEVSHKKCGEICTQQLSTFSRLAPAERFREAALVETHRRGLERATAVCAVQDGAEWLQGFVDYHRADAVRILDFAHAAEYINEIGQAVQAAGGRLPATWFEGVLHRLKHQGPERVLKHLAWLAARYPSPTIQEKLAYLHKREVHMHYPTYQAAGWPIGSGSVESANKVVVEARRVWGWHALD